MSDPSIRTTRATKNVKSVALVSMTKTESVTSSSAEADILSYESSDSSRRYGDNSSYSSTAVDATISDYRASHASAEATHP